MNIFDQISADYPRRALSNDESRALTYAAQEGSSAAASQLLSNYLPLLKRLISTELTHGVYGSTDIDDLRAAAVEGFLDALHGVDVANGEHLSNRVKLRVEDRLKTERIASPVRVPSRTYRRCMAALEASGGSTVEAIKHASEFGITPETMAAVFDAFPSTDSYHLEDRPAPAPRQILAEDIHDAHRALAVLDPTERLVIEALYGFDGQQMSSREAAAALDIPRSTLQRIAKSAVARMQAALGA